MNNTPKDDEKKQEAAQKAIRKLSSMKSQLGSSVFTKKTGANDYKKTSYEKVIANAYSAKGPLCRYYLACVDPEWDAEITRKNGKKLNGTHYDRVLKTIAAYMLERSRKSYDDARPRSEPVNYSIIAFWATSGTKLDATAYRDYKVSGRPLFICSNTSSCNQAKIKPDEEWFVHSGWEVIEATFTDEKLDAFLKEHPGAVFFRDNGGAKPLGENQRYER